MNIIKKTVLNPIFVWYYRNVRVILGMNISRYSRQGHIRGTLGAHQGVSTSLGTHQGVSMSLGAHQGVSTSLGTHQGTSMSLGSHQGVPMSSGTIKPLPPKRINLRDWGHNRERICYSMRSTHLYKMMQYAVDVVTFSHRNFTRLIIFCMQPEFYASRRTS